MKYFKVTTPEDDGWEFYISSSLPNETPLHLAMSLHLGEGDGRYDVVEVSKEEFDRETEDEDPPTFLMGRDFDVDEDYEDNDDECWD
jgi:hypothetical protein